MSAIYVPLVEIVFVAVQWVIVESMIIISGVGIFITD